jgi:hypothetical protein
MPLPSIKHNPLLSSLGLDWAHTLGSCSEHKQRTVMYPVLSKMLIASPQDHMRLILLLQQKIMRLHAMEMGPPLLSDENTETFECKQEHTMFPWYTCHCEKSFRNEYYRTEEATLLMTAKNRESIQPESLLCLNVKTRKDWTDFSSSSFSEFHKEITQNT